MAQIWDPATGQLVEVPGVQPVLAQDTFSGSDGSAATAPVPQAAPSAASRGLGAFVRQQQQGVPWGSASREGVDPRLIAFLDRVHPEIPGGFNVVSGYRDPARNRAAGGASGSQHIQGRAVDTSGFRDDAARQAFLERAAKEGYIRGVGVYPGGSIHIDTRDTPAVWGPNGYLGSAPETFPTWAQPSVRSILGLAPADPSQAVARAQTPARTAALPNTNSDPAGPMGSSRPLGTTLNSTPAAVAGNSPAAASPTVQTAEDRARTWRNPMGMPTAVVNNTPVSQTFDPNNLMGSFQAMGQNTNFTGGIMGIAKAFGAGQQAPKDDPIQVSGALRDTGDAQRVQAAQQMMAQLLQRRATGV